MNLQNYIDDVEKQYHLRLKTVVPLDNAAMDLVERVVDKYQPIDISRPKKTMLQKQPLDFVNVENAEVWIVDMVFALPVTPTVLRADIRKVLKAPEAYVVVHEVNDPSEIEALRVVALAEIEEEALKRGLKPAGTISDEEYTEVEEPNGDDYYGNTYNTALLSYLDDVRASREERRVEPKNALFKYLDLPSRRDQEPVQSDADFNADIKDAPPVVPKKKVKLKTVNQSPQGNVDNSDLVVKRVFLDDKGRRVVLTRTLGAKVV